MAHFSNVYSYPSSISSSGQVYSFGNSFLTTKRFDLYHSAYILLYLAELLFESPPSCFRYTLHASFKQANPYNEDSSASKE